MILMINNLVRHRRSNEILIVKEIYCNGILSNRNIMYPYDEIRPIKIHENWLIKLKFRKFPNSEDYSIGNFVIHKRKRGYIGRSSDGIIDSVHSLQNRFLLTRGKHLIDLEEMAKSSLSKYTSPIIKDLPEEIRMLVIIEQMEQKNEPNLELLLSDEHYKGNFNWGNSIKGAEFWINIDEQY